MLAQMSAREFSEWQEFQSLEPFLGDRVEFMLAQLTALIFNVNRKKNSKAKSARDFLLDTRTPAERERQESALIQAEARFRQVREKAQGARRSASSGRDEGEKGEHPKAQRNRDEAGA